ncbi:MAG TPA: type VII secretion target [Pseudonocardiaceae bacterium]
MSINIRPDPIINAGNAMRELAELAALSIAGQLVSNRAAAEGHPGWASATPLNQVTEAWEAQLGRLTFQLGDLGDQLRISAIDYKNTDAEAARRIQEVFNLLSSP